MLIRDLVFALKFFIYLIILCVTEGQYTTNEYIIVISQKPVCLSHSFSLAGSFN